MLQRKAGENYKFFLKKKKTNKCEYALNWYRKLFVENELIEEEKIEDVNMHAIYIIISTKRQKGMNMQVKNTETFLKKNKESHWLEICGLTARIFLI